MKEDVEDLLGHAKWKAEQAKTKASENFNRMKVHAYRRRSYLVSTDCVQDELQAEGHHLRHGAEKVKDMTSNIRDELSEEREALKEDAKGVWNWLTRMFFGTKHTISKKLKEEEAHTKVPPS